VGTLKKLVFDNDAKKNFVKAAAWKLFTDEYNKVQYALFMSHCILVGIAVKKINTLKKLHNAIFFYKLGTQIPVLVLDYKLVLITGMGKS
jgi:hypothetical protein